jgi:hypothetical protein
VYLAYKKTQVQSPGKERKEAREEGKDRGRERRRETKKRI